MSQPHYAYAAAPQAPRQYSGHNTSSAFSSSANPDEDWTKISDLTERRRMQNRIAQRNYRKKLKRRLEDLERRAGSSDDADSKKQSQSSTKSKRSASSKSHKAQPATPAKTLPSQGQYTPPMEQDDFFYPSSYDNRERSHTPPLFPYSTYPTPNEILLHPHGAAQPYTAMTTADTYPNYITTSAVPVTLPSITHFSDAVKRESYPSDDSLNPYMPYGFMPGIDLNAPSHYDHQSNPYTLLSQNENQTRKRKADGDFETLSEPTNAVNWNRRLRKERPIQAGKKSMDADNVTQPVLKGDMSPLPSNPTWQQQSDRSELAKPSRAIIVQPALQRQHVRQELMGGQAAAFANAPVSKPDEELQQLPLGQLLQKDWRVAEPHHKVELGEGQSVVVDNVPFTDSGYASAPNPDLIAKARESFDKQEYAASRPMTNIRGDDTRTIYSAATTVIPNFTRQSISDVCRDIFAKIGQHVSDKNWTSMYKTIPGLIKAFAIRLNTGATDDLSRHIMHFVHKNHQEITLHLQFMFRHANDDGYEVRIPASDAMSLHDKMNMWGRKSDDDPRKVDTSDLFEGVEENDDDDSWHDLLAYSKAMVSSPAYDWLICSLLKESQFHWDELEPRVMVDKVRQTILAKLPKNRISKQKDPNTYKVTFQLPWSPLQMRIKEEQLKRRASPKLPISSFVVLTSSSSDQVQATTVKQYFDQIWVSGGTELLSAVQVAVDGSHENIPYVSQLGKTTITCTLDEDLLVVTVNGSAHTVAECGEQLSWLGAALQPSYTNCVVHSTPYIALAARHPSSSLVCNQHWEIGFHNESLGGNLMSSLHLDGEVAKSVIVRGFPTRCRPDLCSGIEVSPEILFDLVGAPRLKADDGHFLLQGSNNALGLVKYTDEILVWHVIGSLNSASSCTLHQSSGDIDTVLRSINLNDLWHFRHIVQPCAGAGSLLDNHVPSVTHSCAEEASFLAISSLENSTSRSATVTGPQDASLDSDMLSISDTSEDTSIKPPSPAAALNPIIDVAVHRLLSEYRSTSTSKSTISEVGSWEAFGILNRPVNTHHARSSSGRSLTTDNAPTATAESNQRTLRKRNNPGSNDDENDGDGERQPKRARPDQGESRLLLLACPFWKRNPSKHNDCFKAKLGKISRVKQHMARKHTPAFYCERCLVIFSDKQSHQRHIRHSHCTWDSSVKLDGISHEQHRELTHKSKPNLSESENWFRIWGIVFPNHPPPASAYMDPDLSEDLSRFREFSQRHGPATLVEELRTGGISSFADEDVISSLHEILSRGLNRLYQEWLSTTTPSARSASPNYGRTRPTRHETPVSSLADSGVALRSQELSYELGGYGSSGTRSTDRVQQSDTLNEAQQDPTSLDSIITMASIPDNNHRFDIDESYRQTIRNEENAGEDDDYGASASAFDYYIDFNLGGVEDIVRPDFVHNLI